jgi:predicted  nucleic acid-binding Zn-ribbon protein
MGLDNFGTDDSSSSSSGGSDDKEGDSINKDILVNQNKRIEELEDEVENLKNRIKRLEDEQYSDLDDWVRKDD